MFRRTNHSDDQKQVGYIYQNLETSERLFIWSVELREFNIHIHLQDIARKYKWPSYPDKEKKKRKINGQLVPILT